MQNESNDYRESVDRVEVIKLPAHSTNGSVLPAPSSYTTTTAANNSTDSDAPLNLSLKPATASGSSPISGSQPLSQLSNLSQSLLASDRTCKYSGLFFLELQFDRSSIANESKTSGFRF